MARTSDGEVTLPFLALAGWGLALLLLGGAVGALMAADGMRERLQPQVDQALAERDQVIALLYERELGANTLELVLDGIHGQESSHGTIVTDDAAGTTTCDTAVGEYQVQPRTALWLKGLGKLDAKAFPERTCEDMAKRLRADTEGSRSVAKVLVQVFLERYGAYERALCAYNGLPALPRCGYSDDVLKRVRA